MTRTAKEEAINTLSADQREELEPELEIFRKLAYFNCVEDLKRRVCLDRFEEYLLRKYISEALYELGKLREPTPFCINQNKLCEIAMDVKNGRSN